MDKSRITYDMLKRIPYAHTITLKIIQTLQQFLTVGTKDLHSFFCFLVTNQKISYQSGCLR